MAVFAVSADSSAIVGRVSTVKIPAACGSSGFLEFLPNDAIRRSWGDRPTGYGKWGYAANVPPYSPPYQKTGHPADVFDGDLSTGYVWKTVSVAKEDCPQDSTNCQQLTVNGLKIAAYNQGVGGRRCSGCQGVSGCEIKEQTVLPICSTAVCDYCENLNAVMSFDTMEYLLVRNVSITIRGEHRSPRSFKFYYSVEGIEGPYTEFSNEVFTIDSMIGNTYNFTTSDGNFVVGRYWRIEILSNFGDPEHVELVELALFGRQLNSDIDNFHYKWVSGSNCNNDPLSTTSFTFGFASEQSTVDNGEFFINVNSIQVGPFAPKNDSDYIRDKLYKNGFVTTVSKTPLIVGNKFGQEFTVEFYSNVAPDIVTSENMLTGLSKFPSDVFRNVTSVSPNKLTAYCVEAGYAVIISTFARVPDNHIAYVCDDQSNVKGSTTVYGVNSIRPTYGPRGGVVNMAIDGNFNSSMNITMVSNKVSSSKDCLDALSVLAEDSYPLDHQVDMEIDAEETMKGARFCVRYDDEVYGVVPSAYFSIEEASVTEVITQNCNLALLGESVITLAGTGLHTNDTLQFIDINRGNVIGAGSVIAEKENETFEARVKFTAAGDGYLIAYFSGLRQEFTNVTVHVYDLQTKMDHLVSGSEMDLRVYGAGAMTVDDTILLRSGDGYDLSFASIPHPVITNENGVNWATFPVLITSPADTREYTLYYKPHRATDVCEEPFNLGAVFTFHNVVSVTTKMGNEDVPFITTVLNKETTITLTGLSLNETDTAYYWNEADNIQVNVTFFSTSETERTGNVTFVNEGSYYLRYGFINGESNVEVSYPSLAMKVSSITGIAVGLESNTTQMTVKDLPTLVEYMGNGIHDINRDAAFHDLTPDPSITGGNDASGRKYASNRAVASHGPYVTVDDLPNPMDAVFAFENGGRSTELNHWIIYDFKSLVTIEKFGMYVNSVFFQQLPRAFELQRLLFCYDDSCVFDGDHALENAPWETVLSVNAMGKTNVTAMGGYQNYTLPRPVSARYYRLYITKNWGSPVYTSVIQVNFVGARAQGNDMNLAMWAPESQTVWDRDKTWVVSANGHSTLETFTASNRSVLWYDFSRTGSKVDPIRLSHIRMNVAEVNMPGWTENIKVASNVVEDFKINTVYGRIGDKIKFALPGSMEDADCWTADSKAFGSVIDVQEITLQFSALVFTGSFIIETNNSYFMDLNQDASNGINVAIKKERTVPISIQDTDQVASIKLEQLTGVDKADVTIRYTSNNSITVTISVLEPALAQPDFRVILPSDGPEECRQCDFVDRCKGKTFEIVSSTGGSERVYTLQITDDSECSMDDFLLNREYEMKYTSGQGVGVFTFTPVTFYSSKVLVIASSSLPDETHIVANEVKTCPAANQCTSFTRDPISHAIAHKVRGHAAVGVVQAMHGDEADVSVTFIYNSDYSNLNVPLCYKFGDLPWKIYKNYMIDLRSVIDVTPRKFIVGKEQEVTVTGTEASISEGDELRVLWRGEDCTNRDNLVEFNIGADSKDITLTVGAGGKLIMNFSSSLPVSQSLTLCYKFAGEDEDWVNYPLITFDVMNLVSLEAFYPAYSNNLTVANQGKFFILNGNGLSSWDQWFFVQQTVTRCDEGLKVDATISNKTLLSQNKLKFFVNFSQSYPDMLKICYRFNNYDGDKSEYVMNGDLPLYVVTISGVNPTYGFANKNSVLVNYYGNYPSPYTTGDHAKWVLEDSEEQATVSVDVSNKGSNHTSSVEFRKYGKYTLRYQFGNEPFMAYPNIYMHALELISLNNSHAVVGCLYRPEMEIYYYRALTDPNVRDSLSFKRVGGSCLNADDKLPILSANGAQSNYTDVLNVEEKGDRTAYAEFLVQGISGGDYSFCYRWGNKEVIDYSNIQVTFYSFTGFSIAEGSTSDSLVERIEKTMNVMGSGVAEGDEVRLIVPRGSSDPMCTVEANKGDEECDAPFEDKTFVVSSTNQVNMLVESVPSGKLQVCYKFKNVGYFVKMPVYLTVSGLNSVTVNQGSADVMVVGVSKTFTFNGLGIDSGDRVYWGLTCSGEASDMISAEVPLDENLSATFLFTSPTTTDLILCYSHAQEKYRGYPNYHLTVKELQTVNSVDPNGQTDLAIVDQAKTVEFHGVGIASGTVDVARWVRGTSCESDVVPLMSSSTIDMGSIDFEVDPNDADRYMQITSSSSRLGSAMKAASSSANSVVVGSDHTASFLFAEDSSEQENERFFLCYKFGDEPFKLYEEITMRVFDLYDAASYSKEDKSDSKYLVAAGTMSTVEFSGYGIAEGDRAYWVKSDRTCRPMNALPITSLHLYEENIVYVDALLKTTVNFVNGYDGAVSICYQFQNETPKRYNFPYHVARVNGVRNVDGTNVFVGSVPVKLTFYGYHVNEESQVDEFGWTKGEDCSAANLVTMLNVDTQEKVTMHALTGSREATVQFLEGGTFSLCHIFGKEEIVHYADVQIEVRIIEEIIPWWTLEESAMGYSMSRVAVKGAMKRWNVRGVFETGDLLRFAMTGDCNCNLARMATSTAPTVEVTEIPIQRDEVTGNYYFTVAFLDAMDVYNQPFTVCYRSRSDLL